MKFIQVDSFIVNISQILYVQILDENTVKFIFNGAEIEAKGKMSKDEIVKMLEETAG